LESRLKDGLDSNKYDETLGSVLAELYDLVGKPVIRPTPSSASTRTLPDLVVPYICILFPSSPCHGPNPIRWWRDTLFFRPLHLLLYTNTLRTNPIPPSQFWFAIFSSAFRTACGAARSIPPNCGRRDTSCPGSRHLGVESHFRSCDTRCTVIDGFRDHQFVHFACHGTLEPGEPFEAGFELYGGERLTLLEIVRSHLPAAEFAFLSACHTAEITEGSIMDEGLHLAAAVQYCGFRSVVGTMWAMVDEDGQELAENFYKVLFSNSRRDQGIPYHERSAKALRYAVKKLRRKRWITLERWVNFVHYGA
jgi:hypothetical protein